MELNPGNTFNYKFGKLMEKHKMAKGMMFFHMGERVYNEVELILIGDPNIDWIVAGCDNLVCEMEKRIDAKRISSAQKPFEDA